MQLHEMEALPFTVEFVGYDGWYHALGCKDLQTAQQEAVWLEERGCHSISIFDVEEIEYPH